jgi:Amt family ammonium transporter
MKQFYLMIMAVLLMGSGPFLAQGAEESAALEAVAEVAAAAEEAPAEINAGDTAWMITATVLVLFMTLPGLALFYGGLVRTKNILSVLVQCFAMAAVMSILWVTCGYSLAFGTEGGMNWAIGDLSKIFLKGVTADSVSGSIPETVFITFQMTFIIITPALMVGAFAERMKFGAMMLFSIAWALLSYLPICHMAWSGDGALFWDWEVMDFAGGTVVHINAGIAGLVACIMVGKRKGYGSSALQPHNVPMTVIGASMLWVGWFGFNAGSELAADGTAGMAMLVTQVATAMAALTWMLIEWMKNGKPTAVGIATGAVAGLVAITPASGSAGPMGAILIGFASSVVCFWSATSLKHQLGYDDSLDVFGVHGVGGIVGAVLTGLCAADFMGGAGTALDTVGAQIMVQIKSVLVTIVWSGVVSWVALFVIDKLVGGLRVSVEEETMGLDQSSHGESGYNS